MWLILDEHQHYLTDDVRLSAFRQAINEVVRPGDVVLDLGSGTGVMGLLACHAGAKRVYSVDSGEVIELARQLAKANHYEDRITFIKGLSTAVELPEKVDVVVADQLGYFGYGAGLWEYFSDARQRFLKPGGTLLPAQTDLVIAPIESTELWQRIEFWNQPATEFDFTAAYPLAVNTSYPVKLCPEQLLAPPQVGASVTFSTVTTASFTIEANLVASRAGTLHGIGGWFSARLSPGVTMTNSPLTTPSINRTNLFFPIEHPVTIAEGDRIHVKMHIIPAQQIETWNIQIWSNQAQGYEEPSNCRAMFSHSTWKGMLLGKDALRKRQPNFVPTLSPRGAARLTVLNLFDGQHQLAAIEQEVYRRHPQLFRTLHDAALFVTEVVTRYAL